MLRWFRTLPLVWAATLKQRYAIAGLGAVALFVCLVWEERAFPDEVSLPARWCYDLPLRFQSIRPHRDTLLIEMTDSTYGQRDFFPRSNHVALLRALKDIPARLVFYDVSFRREEAQEAPDARVDAALASALRGVSNLVFCAAISDRGIIFPDPGFATNAAWGHAGISYYPDNVVRRLPGPFPVKSGREYPSASAAAYRQITGKDPVRDGRVNWSDAWLNYYQPAGAVFSRRVPFEAVRDALASNLGGAETLIFVGDISTRAAGDFRGGDPRGGRVHGIDVQATAVLNLLEQDWLRELPAPAQLMLVVAWGLVLPVLLGFRPLGVQLLLAGGATTLLLTASFAASQAHLRTWWFWVVPAGIQAPAAIVAAAATRRTAIASTLALSPARVFISYRAGDGEACARMLHQALSARDIPTFLAPGNLIAGEDYPEELLRRVREARTFVLVLTPLALESLGNPTSWVSRETAQAMEHGRRILIVRAGVRPLAAASLPDAFRLLADKHSLEAQTGNYFEQMMLELVAGL